MDMNRTESGIGYMAVALLAVGLTVKVSALTVTEVSHVTSRPSGATQISGITYAGGNLFYAVDDNDNKLYPLTLAINRSNGSLTTSGITIGTGVVMSGGNDMEGCAFDSCSGYVWISQETSALIREYDPTTGTLYREAPVPAVQKKYRGNYSLEALTISGDGMTMWTANEEALTVDGLLATNSVGSVVRLTRFTRVSVYDNWTPNGEWAYVTQPIGSVKDEHTRSGVSGLCALPDGTLLVLERRCYNPEGWFPDFEVSVYQVNFSGATDVSSIAALNGASYTKTTKQKLWSYKHGNDMPNYEGMCLGPRLDDGSCVLVLISDGGSYAEEGVFTLKLSGLNIWTMGFDAVVDALCLSSIVGTNYRYIDGKQVSVSLSGEGVDAVAYTNNGATVVSATWTVTNAANQTLASGSGTTATFNVSGDGTLAWNVTTNTAVSPIMANDSFEAYAAGTQGNDILGWSGEDAEVVVTNYTASAGYPMAREGHTKVLKVDGDLTRTYPEVVTNAPQVLEFMLAVRRAPAGSEPVAPQASDKIVIVCDSDGRLQVNCKKPDGSTGWVALSSTQYANDDWIRVTITFDYTSNASGRAFAQIKLDGTACTTGVASPTDPATAGGSWYELLQVGDKRCVSSLVASGTCKLDDVILSIEEGQAEPTYIDGVPVVWLDALGLGRNPSQTFPSDGANPNLAARGYTLGDAFDAGIDLTKDEPFQLTDIRLVEVPGSEGKHIQLTFNGVRDDKALADVYHVYYAETLGGEETPVAGTYTPGVGQTIWVSTSPVNPGKGFYRVTATR